MCAWHSRHLLFRARITSTQCSTVQCGGVADRENGSLMVHEQCASLFRQLLLQTDGQLLKRLSGGSTAGRLRLRLRLLIVGHRERSGGGGRGDWNESVSEVSEIGRRADVNGSGG